jgi:hypothetical protein
MHSRHWTLISVHCNANTVPHRYIAVLISLQGKNASRTHTHTSFYLLIEFSKASSSGLNLWAGSTWQQPTGSACSSIPWRKVCRGLRWGRHRCPLHLAGRWSRTSWRTWPERTAHPGTGPPSDKDTWLRPSPACDLQDLERKGIYISRVFLEKNHHCSYVLLKNHRCSRAWRTYKKITPRGRVRSVGSDESSCYQLTKVKSM